MGVQGVTNQGPQVPDRVPADTPRPRDGPEAVRRKEASAQGPKDLGRTDAAKEAQEREAAKEASRKAAEASAYRAGTRLRVDPATERIVAQIIDDMNRVVKQIPPEELLKIVAQTRQTFALLFDESV